MTPITIHSEGSKIFKLLSGIQGTIRDAHINDLNTNYVYGWNTDIVHVSISGASRHPHEPTKTYSTSVVVTITPTETEIKVLAGSINTFDSTDDSLQFELQEALDNLLERMQA